MQMKAVRMQFDHEAVREMMWQVWQKMSSETLKSLLKKCLTRQEDRVRGCLRPRSWQASLVKKSASGEEG